MSADVFAFVQSGQPGLDASANTVQNTKNSAPDSPNKQGLFDNLMTEFSAELKENLVQEENLTPVENLKAPEFSGPVNFFNGGKNFSNSMLDLLAKINPEGQELQPQEENFLAQNFSTGDLENLVSSLKNSINEKISQQDSDSNFWTEIPELENLLSLDQNELKAKLNALPEDEAREVIKLIQEALNALENNEPEKFQQALLNLNTTLEKNSPVKFEVQDEENKDNEEKENENKKTQAPEKNFYEGNKTDFVNPSVPQTQSPSLENENKNLEGQEEAQNFSATDAPRQQRPAPLKNNSENSIPPTENKITDTDSEVKPQNFNRLLDNQEAEEDPQAQNNFSGQENRNSSGQNFSDAKNNFSRSHNDTRRTQNDSRTERTTSQASQRTDSRNDFQGFFEGVLNSRRTFSQSPAQPLNLRTNFNFNQSETLRTGVVNVVRFIRADGVHRANIVIDPPALGRISVELTSGTSGVEASIKVASEQIRQLVQDQLSQLRMNLSQQGVQVAEFTVDVQQDSQQDGRGQGQNYQEQNGRRNFIAGTEEEEPEDFRIDLEDGLLYWIA